MEYKKGTCNVTKLQHTQTPWRVGDAGHTVFGPKMSDGSAPVIIANCDYQQTRASGSKKANAAFIVKACNMHDDVMDLLRDMQRDGTTGYQTAIDVILAQEAAS